MATRRRAAPVPEGPAPRRTTGAPATTGAPVPSPATGPAERGAPVPAVPDPPPPRRDARRKVRVGVAAEAAAHMARVHGAPGAPGAAGAADHTTTGEAPQVAVGTCRCGLPAAHRCAAGCGRPTCGSHLLNGGSRLAWAPPSSTERERTVYLRAFSSSGAVLCAWCRAAAGEAALAALAPAAPLPDGVLERLAAVVRRPHDQPGDVWARTVADHGGPAGVLRLAAPRLFQCRHAREFPGARRAELLVGVSIGLPGGDGPCDVVDADGVLWMVRPLAAGLRRRRPAWAWERAPEERTSALLPRVVDLVVP